MRWPGRPHSLSGHRGVPVTPTAEPTATPPPSPKVDGLEPTFRHLDDPEVPWQPVKAQRNADGSVAHVWEKWLAYSPDPQYLTIYARYDPGMVVRRHGHFSPHVVMVLEGQVSFGERRCGAGTHIELPLGAAFGPVVAGPEGAVMFEVMMGDPRSWGDEAEAYGAAQAAQGAEALPDPPLEFPSWLEDLRTHWARAPTAQPGKDVGA